MDLIWPEQQQKDCFNQFEFFDKFNLDTQNPRRDLSTPSISSDLNGANLLLSLALVSVLLLRAELPGLYHHSHQQEGEEETMHVGRWSELVWARTGRTGLL